MKQTRPAPTVQDVAREANVSTATVSRCLNFPDKVGEATRKRVLQVIADIGYAPNFGARALVAKRTNTIGAIIPTMENAIFARGLQAFQEELGLNGYTLLVASSSYRPDLEEKQIRTLLARGADALLLIGFDRRPEVTEMLRERGVPHLVAWAHDPSSQTPSVGFDNRTAMADLARTVIEYGHTRIAMISAPTDGNDRARDRVSGVRDAAAGRGLDPAAIQILETPYSFENGAEAFGILMNHSPRPTAVICGNDILAIGAMSKATEMGLSVPDDVSITGFDDIEVARVVTPKLTTVHVPHREMGRLSATALIERLQHEKPEAHMQLFTDIRLRETLRVV
nr:LacI family DNA-binding transcriptional regulator [Palleronia sp. THAF1]